MAKICLLQQQCLNSTHDIDVYSSSDLQDPVVQVFVSSMAKSSWIVLCSLSSVCTASICSNCSLVPCRPHRKLCGWIPGRHESEYTRLRQCRKATLSLHLYLSTHPVYTSQLSAENDIHRLPFWGSKVNKVVVWHALYYV